MPPAAILQHYVLLRWSGNADTHARAQVLFELARYHAPSTVFLDEIDALMAARGGEGEHEASRRMKTELLIQVRYGQLRFAAVRLPPSTPSRFVSFCSQFHQ